MKRLYRNLILFSIVLISFGMHYKHFGKDLVSIHVWRQTQTQSTIVNFYEEDMNIFHPHRNERGNGDGTFRMEFPLMQWMVACLYKLFGNHLIITRLSMFVIGIFSYIGIYRLLKVLFKKEFIALSGAWAFTFSPCFFYYSINPIPDNLALCLGIWGSVFFMTGVSSRKYYHWMLSGIFLSFAALCKLPFILYFILPLSYYYLVLKKEGFRKTRLINLLVTLVFMVLPLTWYIKVIPEWGSNGITTGILSNRISPILLLDYLQHNIISTLPELLLNYGAVPFFLAGFYFIIKNKAYQKPLFRVLAVWGITVVLYFLFEINMIAKIHDYYLFPFLPLLFILVGFGAFQLYSIPKRITKFLVIFLLLLLPVTAFLRMQNRWNTESPGFNKDLLDYKDDLRKAVPKNALCIAGNDESHFIFFYYIDKKGWGFQDNTMGNQSMDQMIREGASYLYSDSREIEHNKNISPFLDKMIMERGSIRIYRLKSF